MNVDLDGKSFWSSEFLNRYAPHWTDKLFGEEETNEKEDEATDENATTEGKAGADAQVQSASNESSSSGGGFYINKEGDIIFVVDGQDPPAGYDYLDLGAAKKLIYEGKITFGDLMKIGSNATKSNNSFVLGPVTIGWTGEIAVPKIGSFVGDGFGFSVGLIADINGIAYYYIDKSVGQKGGIAFAWEPEFSYVHGHDGFNPSIFTIRAKGTNLALSLGNIGGIDFSFGKNGKYSQYGLSGVASGIFKGFSIPGFVKWQTTTTVVPLVYPKN